MYTYIHICFFLTLFICLHSISHSIQVPSYMSEFVMVTAWVQENGMHLYPNTDIGGKYTVLSNGELYINNASPSDAFKAYTCRTVNRLTGMLYYCFFIPSLHPLPNDSGFFSSISLSLSCMESSGANTIYST